MTLLFFNLEELPQSSVRLKFMMAQDIRNYYDSHGSRLGYWIVLGNRRHFEFYPDKEACPWPCRVTSAQHQMESKLLGALGIPEEHQSIEKGFLTNA